MNSNKKTNDSDDYSEKTGIIYIINNFKVKNRNQPFRCIMIYQDKQSGFSFIQPLLYKIDLEIVMELFKIFTTYGPPFQVHVNSCSQEMVMNIAANMKALCPEWKIEFVKKNFDTNKIIMLIITKLHEWIERTGKNQWEIGCGIIQWDMNTTKNAEGNCPYDLFFSLEHSCPTDNESNEECTDSYSTGTAESVTETPDIKPSQVISDIDSMVKVKVERLESDEIDLLSNELENFVSVCVKQEKE